VKVLKRFAREIRKKLPVDPMQRLQRKLDRAVKDERYEEAAVLRDKLIAMQKRREGPKSEVR
jgi:protein-arginine kinase activator protein McsA